MNNTVHVKYISLLLGLVGFNHYHFFLMANYFRPDQAQQSCWASSGLNWFRILSLAHFTRSGPAILLGLAGLELTPELSQWKPGQVQQCLAGPRRAWVDLGVVILNPIMSSNFLFNIKWLNDLFGGAAMSLVIVLCLNDLFGGAAMSMTLRDCDVKHDNRIADLQVHVRKNGIF